MEKSANCKCRNVYRLIFLVFLFIGLLNISTGNCQAVNGLLPGKYLYAPNDSALFRLSFLIPSTVENQKLDVNDLQQLRHYAPDGFDYDLQKHLQDAGGMPGSFYVDSLQGGTHMVILHSKNIYKEFPRDSIHEYIKKYVSAGDLKNFNESSDSTHKTTMQFQLSFKCILQAGKIYSDNSELKTSLPLDIVPQKNVYAAKKGKPVKTTFTVYFKGKPVKKAKIHLMHRNNDGIILSGLPVTADNRGRIKIRVEQTGEWIISSVHLVKTTAGSKAEWQNYLAGVSWGFK